VIYVLKIGVRGAAQEAPKEGDTIWSCLDMTRFGLP